MPRIEVINRDSTQALRLLVEYGGTMNSLNQFQIVAVDKHYKFPRKAVRITITMCGPNYIAIVLSSVIFVGCGSRGSTTASAGTDSVVVNCLLIKPVVSDSKADSMRFFDFSSESLDAFLAGIVAEKRRVIYDSAMDYVTGFERQQVVLLNHDCFRKLRRPDSCGLESVYFNTFSGNSGSAVWLKNRPFAEFLKTYDKNIFDFGRATVFEYRFNNVAEAEPHFMYLLLKSHTEDDEHYSRDFKGIIICSDGLDWKDYPNGYSVPLFIQMVRRSKEFYIPLYFDGARFIPMDHFKTSNWSE